MKFRTRLFCSIILFLTVIFPASAQTKVYGLELCNSVYNFLKKNAFHPETQSLVTSGENTFPYNISVTFNSPDSSTKENLVIIIPQEDINDNQAELKETLSNLKNQNNNFNITVLFAYGEKQKIEKQDMIFGTQVFMESLNSNLEYTAVIFDFDAERNSIETISSGMASPSWLIRNSYNIYKELGIDSKLPRFFLSQIASYKFIHNRQLSNFFDNEIPAIILKIKKTDIEKYSGGMIEQTILKTVEKYSLLQNKNWEHHFFMMKLFGRYRILSERFLLRIILPTILLWITFIFMLFFVNTQLKKRAWSTIRKIWYSIPAIYILLTFCFFISRLILTNLLPDASDAGKIYGILVTQILASLFISLCFFVTILSINYNFDENAIDYLLVICCFINQSTFILIDISLAPIFISICMLSLIALTVKNNALHVMIFILMLIPLIPYGNSVISLADTRQLAIFIKSNSLILLVIPLALYPNFIILFRTLTSMRSKKNTIFNIVKGAVGYFIFVSASLAALGLIRFKLVNENQISSPSIELSAKGEEIINLSYTDNRIFDDLIRTINIGLKEDCLLCDVQVTSRAQNPVLYTDNEYRTISSNSVRFIIPDYPPRNMTFSYGASTQPCRIMVSAVIEGEEKGTYNFISKSISIGEN